MNRTVRSYANVALFNLGVKGKVGNKFSLQQVKLQTFTGEFPVNNCLSSWTTLVMLQLKLPSHLTEALLQENP